MIPSPASLLYLRCIHKLGLRKEQRRDEVKMNTINIKEQMNRKRKSGRTGSNNSIKKNNNNNNNNNISRSRNNSIKNSVKKRLAAALCLTLVLGMLTACGKPPQEDTVIRIGSLKGPTSMGILELMEETEQKGEDAGYTFQMAAAADELLPLMVKGELDIALIPANVASVLYHKMEGRLSVIDINTLGVLYLVSGDTSIQKIADLEGRTVYLTGMGTTPDYVLQYLLSANGVESEKVNLEYKSEAAEVAALLAEEPEAIGLLPQPFVTAACMQNEALSVIMDMNEEWSRVQGEGGSRLVTGVTVVRSEFLEENEAAVQRFLEEHASSTEAVNADPQKGAALAVKAGIVAGEPIALKAIPQCNITCITGDEMKQALSGYLQVLYEQQPEAVGGSLPEDAFYYISGK